MNPVGPGFSVESGMAGQKPTNPALVAMLCRLDPVVVARSRGVEQRIGTWLLDLPVRGGAARRAG